MKKRYVIAAALVLVAITFLLYVFPILRDTPPAPTEQKLKLLPPAGVQQSPTYQVHPNPSSSSEIDLNRDGKVDIVDWSIFEARYSKELSAK